MYFPQIFPPASLQSSQFFHDFPQRFPKFSMISSSFPPFFPHPKAGTAHGLQGREADFAQASADATGMAVAMEQLRTEHRATLQGGMLVRLDGFDLGLKSMCKNRTMIA